MSFLVLKKNKFFEYLWEVKSEQLGLYVSFFLHFLILFSVIGLPNFFGPKQISVPIIIPIEIINVTDVTSIPKENITESKSIETKKIKVNIKEKKFNSSNNQEIKKIDIKEKPKIKENMLDQKILLKEKKDSQINSEKQKIEIDTNKFESLPTKKIKPKLKPQPKIKKIIQIKKSDVVRTAKPKQKLVSEVVRTAKPKPKLENEFNIASMLKDLRNEKTTKKVENNTEENKNKMIVKVQEESDNELAQLSISEIDLVLQQLSRCFISPAGAEIKKTMFVKISAKIQPNRKVYKNSIRIVDTNISKSSSLYGPITESAMRTLLNPECIPLKLPEEKYELWRNLTMKFDYSVMRGN